MKITRRTFLKGTAGAAGGAVAVHFLYGRLDTLRKARAEKPLKEEWAPTTCWIGKQDCGILARKINGRVVKLEGNPAHPRNKGTLCPKGMGQIFAMYDTNRVQHPLIRTNKKGEHGKFRKATWDEALELVAKKIREAQEKAEKELGKGASKKNNPFIIWQKGRSKAKPLYDKSIVPALGATKLHHGAYCSDAGYRAMEYTVGCHGVLHPDFSHVKYVLSWGWNITNAGGNKLCWITWPRKMLNARERGLKITVVDPRLRGAGPFADRWVPIKPGTDLAFALSLCHEVVRTRNVDWAYLKQYTNSPYLVGEDGYFLRKNGKELVWDLKSKSAVPHDQAGIDPALEGEYTIDGKKYRPSFEVFKEHLKQYTPKWASQICDIPEDQITTIARELVENAHIGSTIRVKGKNGWLDLPYRPVGIMGYHITQQELGFQLARALGQLMMLLGSFGAVGGQMVNFHWKVHKNYHKWENVHIKEETNIYLKDSKFYPINSNLTGIVAKVVQNPKKYGVKHLPEVCLIHMTNPVVAYPSQKDIKALFEKIPFTAVVDPWLSETADLYADVVLPCSTIEKWEGPIGAGEGEEEAVTMRIPITTPIYDTKSDVEIYMDLCEKVGKETLKKY
ncbi:MAG: twin-arginine translocation signal domain-containing protein, partial [Planctomycetota bacterium]